jgi:hypothetical protein
MWAAEGVGMPEGWHGIASDDGVAGGLATYSGGILDWTSEYDDLRTSWEVETCDSSHYWVAPYSGSTKSGYGSKSSMPCTLKTSYERWSFTAPADEDVYVSVDTLDAGTAFDPAFWMTDDETVRMDVGFTSDGFPAPTTPVASVRRTSSPRRRESSTS